MRSIEPNWILGGSFVKTKFFRKLAQPPKKFLLIINIDRQCRLVTISSWRITFCSSSQINL